MLLLIHTPTSSESGFFPLSTAFLTLVVGFIGDSHMTR